MGYRIAVSTSVFDTGRPSSNLGIPTTHCPCGKGDKRLLEIAVSAFAPVAQLARARDL